MLLLPTLVPAMILSTHLTIAVADPVPNFSIEPSCRSVASGETGIKQDLSVCLDDEKEARNELVKEWNEFAAKDRSLCTRLATTGGSPTYTELLVCLQMSRDARKLSKDDVLDYGR